MRLYKFLNEDKEPNSGDKIKLKSETNNLSAGKESFSSDEKTKPGMYDVVELWENGILIENKNGRYFISRKSDYEII